MKRVTRKLTLPCVKGIANGNVLYVSGNSKRGYVSTYRGVMGRRWDGGERGGDICPPMADSC